MPSPRADFTQQLLNVLQAASIRKVDKPWGTEVIVDAGAFLLKLVEVREGARTSLQHHERKDEVQMILFTDSGSGVAVWPVVHGEREVVRVPPGRVHRTIGPCVLLEVTTPENDDVVRHEDDYDRVTPVVPSDDSTHFAKSPRRTSGLAVHPSDFATGYGGHS